MLDGLRIENFEEFKKCFDQLPINYRTKDLNAFNLNLIRNNVDVSFLKDYAIKDDRYNRTYFQVSLSYFKDFNRQLDFIEDNFDLLNSWWSVDQLTQFLNKDLNLKVSIDRSKKYKSNSNLFVRRFGFVIFLPRLVKEDDSIKLFDLFYNDKEYYVQMAEAWLLSFLAIYHEKQTYDFLKYNTSIEYSIKSKAISKICDSFRISEKSKTQFRDLRKLIK